MAEFDVQGAIDKAQQDVDANPKKLPQQVLNAAEYIGDYIGHTHAYFDEQGNMLDDDSWSPRGTKYIVTGNYYGTSVFEINELGQVKRVML